MSRLLVAAILVVAVAAAGPAGPASRPDVVASGPAEFFRSECAAKAAAAEKAGHFVVTGKDGWLFFGPELRHLSVGKFWGPEAAKVSLATRSEWADPLPAILDFKSQLDSLGIELILLPVPPKAAVYPDKLSDRVRRGADGLWPRLDVHLQAFYKRLGKEGVTVLDLTDEFRKARKRHGDRVKLYCQSDTHWSPTACRIAARALAARLGPASRPAEPKGRRFTTTAGEAKFYGDLWRALGRDASARETVRAEFVRAGDSPVQPDRQSPILLMGDSHCLVFHVGGDLHAKGAGLADHLSAQVGFAVDLLGVRGSGATPSRISLYRRSRRDKAYLPGKKLIIWCLSVREFTEGPGWRKVPVVGPAGAAGENE